MQNQITKNWQKVKLGEIANFSNGKSVKLSDDGNYKVYGSNGLIGKGSNFNYTDGVIIGRVGAYCGSLKYEASDFWATDNTIVGQLKEKSDNKYLYYLLGILKLNRRSGGSAQPLLTQDILNNLEATVPPNSDERKKLSSIISAFDDKIEVNNKIAKTLEEMAQEIFKEWFVNFKFHGHEKVKMIDSELGKTPEGWKAGKIGDLIEIISGFAFPSKLYTSRKDALGVVTIKNVQDGSFSRSFDSFIVEEDLPDNFKSVYFLEDGDILLSLTGNVGRVCFVYGGRYLLNQRVGKIKPKNKIDLSFCYFLFRQNSFQNYLINLAKGSAQPNLSPVETAEISFTIPPREILDNFSTTVSPIYDRLIKIANENQKLVEMRDLLLPKLMRREIRV